MPAFQMLEFRFHLDGGKAGEVDRHQSRNVGDGINVAGNIATCREHRVQPFEALVGLRQRSAGNALQ
jgi:hypothetical protein